VLSIDVSAVGLIFIYLAAHPAHRDTGGKMTLAIFRCRKITIAAVNGHAAGVGITGLQLPCDFRFIWAGAKLAFPFIRRGIAPEGTYFSCRWAYEEGALIELHHYAYPYAAASTFLLPRLLGYSRAVGLVLSGGTYSPDSPLLQGLYHATFPNREDVFPAALAFARELAENTSQTAVAWTKALLWRGVDSIEGQHILDSRGISDLASRGDAADGALAFKEHRPVRFSDVLSRDLSEFVPWVSSFFVRVDSLFMVYLISGRNWM